MAKETALDNSSWTGNAILTENKSSVKACVYRTLEYEYEYNEKCYIDSIHVHLPYHNVYLI